MPGKDNIFEKPLTKQFEFDEDVAAVFDDMIERSVPFYRHSQKLVVDLLARRLREGDRVVDLGSSTGALLIELAGSTRHRIEMVGVDNAPAMVEQARRKARALGVEVTFECEDILDYDFGASDAIVANYTLQFVRPLKRQALVERIHNSLKKGGIFVCSEKVLMENRWLDRQIIEIYYEYKRSRGYSETEIMRKREALENVLIPYTIEENRKMLKAAGFATVDTLFQWANFVTMAAFKA